MNTRIDKTDIYRLTISTGNFRRQFDMVKKKYDVKNPGKYVYDIEIYVPPDTRIPSQFHAGVGGLIVKNTDSIMVKSPVKNIDESIALSKKQCKF